jgi:hypothetical protein
MSVFNPREARVGFVMSEVALGQVLLRARLCPVPIIISPVLHTHLSSGAGTVGPFGATLSRSSVSRVSTTKESQFRHSL